MRSIEKRDFVRLGVLDLNTHNYAGHQDEVFGYAASLSKLFAPMPLLQDVSLGRIKLSDTVLVDDENWVGLDEDTPRDPRPPLSVGERKSWADILDLSITRSDDTAANLVIEYAGRERVNQLVAQYQWQGSEITRKFLPRIRERPEYQTVRPTVSCAKHFVELLYRIQMDSYVCRSASAVMRELLVRQLDKRTLARAMPYWVKLAHKTAWFTSNLPELSCQGECGIVEDRNAYYIIACMVNLPGEEGREVLREVGRTSRQLFV